MPAPFTSRWTRHVEGIIVIIVMIKQLNLYLIMFAFRSMLTFTHASKNSHKNLNRHLSKANTLNRCIKNHTRMAFFSSGGSSPDPKLYNVSVCAVQGGRSYMEDEFFVNAAGNFGAVFDGHGGPAVSRYLRQNLYANLQALQPSGPNVTIPDDHQHALAAALQKVDREVSKISHWSFQGATVVAAWILAENTLLVANIGDSRAVLCHNSTAITLTRDHKPDSPKEKSRIEASGGRVVWSGLVDDAGEPVPDAGVYRVNGNLALSRAVGDRSERPAICAEPEFTVMTLDDQAQFVILATDGLWDVMTAQDVVDLVEWKLQERIDGNEAHTKLVQSKMAEFLVAEALRRGTYDNVTVVIMWL